jgi:hypothetical protein
MSISTQFSRLKTFSDKIWLAQDSVQIDHPVLQLGFHSLQQTQLSFVSKAHVRK